MRRFCLLGLSLRLTEVVRRVCFMLSCIRKREKENKNNRSRAMFPSFFMRSNGSSCFPQLAGARAAVLQAGAGRTCKDVGQIGDNLCFERGQPRLLLDPPDVLLKLLQKHLLCIYPKPMLDGNGLVLTQFCE